MESLVNLELTSQNGGFFASFMIQLSLLSMRNTSDIVGLSKALFWTHNNPILIKRDTCDTEHEPLKLSSTNIKIFPSLQTLQA